MSPVCRNCVLQEFFYMPVNLLTRAFKVAGYTAKNKKEILYPDIPSAVRAIPHGPHIPVPLPPESDTLPSASSSAETESPVDHTYEPDNTGHDRCFNQKLFEDFERDLSKNVINSELTVIEFNHEVRIGVWKMESLYADKSVARKPMKDHDRPADCCSHGHMPKQRWTIIQPEWRYRMVSTMIPPAVIADFLNWISLAIVDPQVHHDAG
ncbi:hypothetical protein ANN_01362 [Periplaneta americana]|uniref:Uncharacterized protein n=1 Tax=Periplaneta americana TaxID=6978 RepID=A0ABQ8TXE7_PERAM|nr:hypothetical protein ANN_01362 [Periplaneta americana]